MHWAVYDMFTLIALSYCGILKTRQAGEVRGAGSAEESKGDGVPHCICNH
jgi:hypothetical protein